MSAVATLAPTRVAFRRLATILVADQIEPCLDFWVDRLGFQVRMQVQGDDQLDFAVLGRDDVEVMYRSRASLGTEAASSFEPEALSSSAVLYIHVEDIDAVLSRLDDSDIVSSTQESAFGSRIVYLREPSGSLIALVAHDGE